MGLNGNMSKTYNQNHINDLAIRDREAGTISKELFDQVRWLGVKRMNKSSVPADYYDGYICFAIANALKTFDPKKGNFSFLVKELVGAEIYNYTRKVETVVAYPYGRDKKIMDMKIDMIYPEGITF